MRCSVLIFVITCCLPSFLTQSSTETTLTAIKNEEYTTKPSSKLVGIQLPPFSQLAHGLRSGPITILDDKTFFIEDLHYDGKAPDAHFWVGTGPQPTSGGILVPSETGSNETLPAYNGQNITIRLPGLLMVDQIDYLGVWCIEYNHNFGHTIIPRNPLTQRRALEPLGVQLEPFSQLAHGLRSGPIVVVDKSTFFIPNLHYDGKGPDAHFWVGNGAGPSPTGILVPDENGSKDNLRAYTGQNIYIRLPDGLTIDKIDYLGMWCIQYKHNFGHVIIPKAIKVPEYVPDPHYTADQKRIVRVQKCCPMDKVLLTSGCTKENQPFNPVIDFHTHNSTHIEDTPIAAQAIRFEPFVNSISCKHNQYPLFPGEDRFVLLENGSLIVLNTKQILSQDSYCIETVDFGDETTGNDWVTTAIICFSSAEVPISSSVFLIYAVGVLVSGIFLVITALVFIFVKEVRDTRGKCVIAYSISMAAAFICLAIAQFSGIDDETCTSVGFAMQFFLVSSFTWLTMISWETHYKIKNYDNDRYTKDRKRLWIYVGLGISVTIITSIISWVIDHMPGIPNTVLKPQFGRNSCWFDQKKGTMLFFYLPVGIAIACNMVLAILMKWNLVWFQKHRRYDVCWKTVRDDLKPMFRSCVLLLSVMSLCWVMEIISFAVKSEGGVWTAIDIINSLQGLFVFLIYVLHRPVKDKICKSRKEIDYNTKQEDKEMTVLNGNGTAWTNHNNCNDFISNLKRTDSVENLT